MATTRPNAAKKYRIGLLVFFIIMASSALFSCQRESKPIDPDLYQKAFDQYKEGSLTHRRFKHGDILPLIEKRKDLFQKRTLGRSVQGKDIFELSYGNGPTKVMLWSQMHGNESTATMALFDLFNFLEGENDGMEQIRNTVYENLDIRFIPMVNPDGAEVFQRRNALGIDLNRDAVKLTSPEAVLLKEARDEFEPAFGFNLHDQSIYYNAAQTPNPATISLLAPAYNVETEINSVRGNAMKIIVGMNRLLQNTIPGHVGKYNDAFEPRAFGDNFQKWGTSTILIESGGYPNDPEKQHIRKINFMIILNALYEIATASYEQYQLEDYFAIPDNDSKMMALIIKNLSVEDSTAFYEIDLGIRRREVEFGDDYYEVGSIEDMGDLSVFYGYKEIDAKDLSIRKGKIWDQPDMKMEELNFEKAIALLGKGFIGVKVKGPVYPVHELPLLVFEEEISLSSDLKPGSQPDFFLERNGEIVYAIVNGHCINLQNPVPERWKSKVR